jgi:hypothetical protein
MLATVVRTLAVAFWIGGMAALDFIEAPVRFASPLLDRNQAVGLGAVLFARQNRVELVLGFAALVSAVLARSARWTVALVALMLALVAVQAAYLTPAITRLARGLDFVHRMPGDPRYEAIRPLHNASAGLEAVVLAAGITVLAVWALPGRR